MQLLTFLGFCVATAMASQVTIHNHCPTPIWLKPDSAGATGTPVSIPIKSAWITDLKGQGNAFKLASTKETLDKPIQFDYSVSEGDGFTYYDITDGVGNPFPVMAHGDDCAQVSCPGTADTCKTTKTCSKEKSVHVYACP